MKRSKIIQQLESEMVAAEAALADAADNDYIAIQNPAFYDGYWVGREFGLRQALTLLTGKELDHE